MSIDDLLDNVRDQETFLQFVSALVKDREIGALIEKEDPVYWSTGGANGWQNNSIESFLDAAVFCVKGKSGPKREALDALAKSNPWRYFAEFLYGGKVYE